MDLTPEADSETGMRAFELPGFDEPLLDTRSLLAGGAEDEEEDENEEKEKDLLISDPELEPTPIRHG
jgi:hypothetical protein